MQTQVKWMVAAVLAGSALMASAEEAHHPDEAPASATPASAPVDPALNTMMTEQMQKMQAAHDKAAAAQTPAERQAAMQEGMQAMRDGMAMLSKQQAAAGCMGMGMGASSGMGKPGAKDGMGMHKGMMDMMMRMMDQQSSMMNMPMTQ